MKISRYSLRNINYPVPLGKEVRYSSNCREISRKLSRCIYRPHINFDFHWQTIWFHPRQKFSELIREYREFYWATDINPITKQLCMSILEDQNPHVCQHDCMSALLECRAVQVPGITMSFAWLINNVRETITIIKHIAMDWWICVCIS